MNFTGRPHAAGVIPDDAKLHVCVMISNPVRYRSRYALLEKYMQQTIKTSRVEFWLVEVALRNRQFEVTQRDERNHLQLRSESEIWHKENALNVLVSKVLSDDPSAEYFAFIDADVVFARADWAEETLHQLQHYDVVQMWSHSQDVGPQFEPIGKGHKGFVWSYYNDPQFHLDPQKRWGYTAAGHPGYAWAWRKSALDTCGGLLDFAIVGGGDRHMACGLIGAIDRSGPFPEAAMVEVSGGFNRCLMQWQTRALRLAKNIGYVDGLLLHQFHGRKVDRKYGDRWRIYTDHSYCPHADLRRAADGLYALEPGKTGLRDDLRSYFYSRNEDSLEVA